VRLKDRVRQTQFRAARAVNTEVLRLYWSIGRDILDRQQSAGWGSQVVEMLAADLKREFPDQRGWSRRNLLYMRRAAQAWPTESEFVQQAAAQLPWGHLMVILDRLKARDERDWYTARTPSRTSTTCPLPKSSLARSSRTSPQHWPSSKPSPPRSSRLRWTVKRGEEEG